MMKFGSTERIGIAMSNVAPLPTVQPRITGETPRADLVRWVISIHIFMVIFSLTLTLADRGLLVNNEISMFFYPTTQLPWILPSLAIPLCPLFLLVEIVRQRVACRSAVLGGIAEALLCVTHLMVLLPASS